MLLAISPVPPGSSDSLTVIYPPTLERWRLASAQTALLPGKGCWLLPEQKLSPTSLAFSPGAADEEKDQEKL